MEANTCRMTVVSDRNIHQHSVSNSNRNRHLVWTVSSTTILHNSEVPKNTDTLFCSWASSAMQLLAQHKIADLSASIRIFIRPYRCLWVSFLQNFITRSSAVSAPIRPKVWTQSVKPFRDDLTIAVSARAQLVVCGTGNKWQLEWHSVERIPPPGPADAAKYCYY